jgi:NADH-quinone oxidoreductase subunit E
MDGAAAGAPPQGEEMSVGGSAGVPAFSEAQLAEVRRLQALYPDRRGALLPVLRMAQETFGAMSPEVEVYIGGLFELSPAHVHEVVTFYTLFFQRPVGRHVLSVCHNLSCSLLGAEDLIAYLGERLRIEPGETTPDGRVTLLRVECLCACEMAPMMQVDDEYVGPLTRETVDAVLGRLA